MQVCSQWMIIMGKTWMSFRKVKGKVRLGGAHPFHDLHLLFRCVYFLRSFQISHWVAEHLSPLSYLHLIFPRRFILSGGVFVKCDLYLISLYIFQLYEWQSITQSHSATILSCKLLAENYTYIIFSSSLKRVSVISCQMPAYEREICSSTAGIKHFSMKCNMPCFRRVLKEIF